MSEQFSFRGTRYSTAHAHSIYDGAPAPWSACHLATERAFGDVDPDAKQCRKCIRRIGRWDAEVVERRPEWDLYLEAIHRAEKKARDQVREMFYGPRRRVVTPAATHETSSSRRDTEAVSEHITLMNERLALKRGVLPEDDERRRAEETTPEALAAFRAGNEAMAAELRRKQLKAV